ncbi:GtrA family protein [Neobacillus vireti]|uniref:GtrA-like protein n=1 Tax=Neobacillus vireti LMG 21834 TaxID=1131730 RepID=A0AB94IRI3_9BACI|nr:GtrA family protein [Neobacillus vireti]ETI69710.1 GtrA-like protein [Neobacillus vireti LMG 21834]KLT18262.1 sugar translocase [Neobacillus vireti]
MKKFLKFGVVGIVNTLITIGSFTVFVYFGMNYIAANIIAYGLGMMNSFFLNKNWVFQAKSRRLSLVIKFMVVNFLTLGFTTICLYILVRYMDIHSSAAQIISTCIGLAINFLLNKKWTFSEKELKTV